MRLVPAAASTVFVLVAAFLGITWWALESSGVALVTTTTPRGDERTTHVWYAQEGDVLWLEAGRPQHPWYQDIQRSPEVTISAEDLSGRYVLSTVPGKQAARHVRALMREKYGLRDRWVLLFVDASETTAVRAVPAGEVAP